MKEKTKQNDKILRLVSEQADILSFLYYIIVYYYFIVRYLQNEKKPLPLHPFYKYPAPMLRHYHATFFPPVTVITSWAKGTDFVTSTFLPYLFFL